MRSCRKKYADRSADIWTEGWWQIYIGGNERYAKTLVRGLCVNFPDYALIVVDAQACAVNKKIEKKISDNFRIAFAF